MVHVVVSIQTNTEFMPGAFTTGMLTELSELAQSLKPDWRFQADLGSSGLLLDLLVCLDELGFQVIPNQ